MTAVERTEERRAQLRASKQRSRQRAKENGLCIVCTSNSVTNTVVCGECVKRSIEWERARGWRKKSGSHES